MDFYMKWGGCNVVLFVFSSMRNRDFVFWNIIIYGYFNYGVLEIGLWFFIYG